MQRILGVVTFMLLTWAYAQDINHFSFNELYDFDVATVFDINESSDHIMWFGTSEGLVSFDGVTFKKYVNNQYAISYTNVKFDHLGRVWCSNFGGQLFYLDEDSLKLAVNWSTNGDFISDYSIQGLPEIIILGNGAREVNRSVLGKEDKEVIYTAEHGKLFTLPFKKEMQFAIHENNSETSKGTLQILKPGTLPGQGSVEQEYAIDIPSGKYSLFGDSAHLFINVFHQFGEVNLLSNGQTKTVVSSIDLSTYRFNGIDYVGNKIWVLSKNGVVLFDNDGTPYTNEALKGISASCLYQDHEGNIWVGSLNRGITIVPNLNFNSLQVSQNSIANSTLDEKGNLYIIDDQGGLFKSSPPFDNVEQLDLAVKLEPAPLFFDNDKGRLYMGTFAKYFDPRENRIVNRNLGSKSSAYRFKNSTFIGDGYYVNTNYVNAYIHKDEDGTNPVPLNFENKGSSIRSYRSKHIQATADLSGLYIDYIDGLFYYDKKESPRNVTRNNRQIQTAAFQKDEIDKDLVWVATKSQELLAIEKGVIIERIELPVIARKIALTEDYIFMAAQNGIYRYNRNTEALETIDETNGWMKGRTTSLFIDADFCVIVGDQYIQRFPVDFSTKNTVKPEVFITYMKVDDLPYEFGGDNKLSAGSNFISFGFRALSVRSQKKLIYQYRLSSESNDWITTAYDNPEARFFNLDAGVYHFEVRACNESGLCSDIKRVDFTIKTPFFRQWWFFAVLVLTAGFIVFVTLRNRYKNKEKQERLESDYQRLRKETYKSKIAAIRSQMNPHFIFNALNTIQEFILTNQQDIASEYLADFADLMRIYLNQSKEENISISEEEESLQLYLRLENLRFNGELDYRIEVDERINKDGTHIPVMLLQPYVENSIKHGLLHKKGKKQLSIRFEKKENHIRCTIEDNGVGRTASTRINAAKSIGHKSFATGANNSRIDLINKNRESKIKVDIIDLYREGEPVGTRVEIVLN